MKYRRSVYDYSIQSLVPLNLCSFELVIFNFFSLMYFLMYTPIVYHLYVYAHTANKHRYTHTLTHTHTDTLTFTRTCTHASTNNQAIQYVIVPKYYDRISVNFPLIEVQLIVDLCEKLCISDYSVPVNFSLLIACSVHRIQDTVHPISMV